MYKLITQKCGSVTIAQNGSIIIQDKIKYETIRVEIDGQEVTDIPDMENIFSIYTFDDGMFVAYNHSENTLFYNTRNFKEILSFDIKFSSYEVIDLPNTIYFIMYNKLYEYKKKCNILFSIDFPNKEYYSKIINNDIIVCLNCNDQCNLIAYSHIDSQISTLWHIDTFNDLFPNYKRKDDSDFDFRIYQVKVYEGDFIVATTAGIARLDAKTGKTVWKTEKARYASSVEIVGNIGYVNIGKGSVFKINLDNGNVSCYDWEYNGFPRIVLGDKSYYVWSGDLVFHDGLLWFTSNGNGVGVIVAMNPVDGRYVWVDRVCYDYIYDPQFHDDKMYISDINGNLFIYQKQD